MNESKRETKGIDLPSGKSVEIKTYVTGREANSIKEELFKAMKFDVAPDGGVSSKASASDISPTFILEQEKKLLSIIVVSVAGDVTDILNRLLDLSNDDYQTIVAEVNKVYRGNLAQEK